MNARNQTAELAQMQQAGGEVMPPAAAALMQPQARSHVVQATNDALPPHAWIVATVVVVGIPSVTAIVMLMLGAPGWLSLIAWLLLAGGAMYWTLQLMSGDWAAMREIRQTNKTERHRIDKVSRAVDNHYSLEQAKEANRHAEEMARIERLADGDTMHRMIMGLQATVARLADAQDVRATIAQPSTFVPATPQIAVSRAKKWVAEMMAESTDGMAPNIAKVGMPWNGEWKGEPWAQDARQWLLDHVLEQHGTVYRWRDEFATVAEAQETLRRL